MAQLAINMIPTMTIAIVNIGAHNITFNDNHIKSTTNESIILSLILIDRYFLFVNLIPPKSINSNIPFIAVNMAQLAINMIPAMTVAIVNIGAHNITFNDNLIKSITNEPIILSLVLIDRYFLFVNLISPTVAFINHGMIHVINFKLRKIIGNNDINNIATGAINIILPINLTILDIVSFNIAQLILLIFLLIFKSINSLLIELTITLIDSIPAMIILEDLLNDLTLPLIF